MAHRPAAVAFDVVETLIALEPLGKRFETVGLPAHSVREFFPRTLLYGVGVNVTGDYIPFPVAAAAAVRTIARHSLTPDQVDYVVSGMRELPAHADVEPAMRVLNDAGIRVTCLTNGAPEVVEAFLARNGLESLVEKVLTTSELQAWKPPAKVYLHAATELGLPPDRVCLVACHAWDCHGAKRAGLMAGWVARAEGGYDEIFAPADVLGDDLVAVARALADLPSSD
ncbi:haloacid dehalogenase type II [Sporichthya polymorpha]|uniref:haloacid dehalogenase type II n=1 Tax=Sporichthya polymorpha TaxID=35751 RepID=UPI000371FFBB|nr:haloacid dehalogenase type II [Sporichthya polymorpha]